MVERLSPCVQAKARGSCFDATARPLHTDRENKDTLNKIMKIK